MRLQLRGAFKKKGGGGGTGEGHQETRAGQNQLTVQSAPICHWDFFYSTLPRVCIW